MEYCQLIVLNVKISIITLSRHEQVCLTRLRFKQGFGREKDGNCGKFIGSNLVMFYYKRI